LKKTVVKPQLVYKESWKWICVNGLL